MNLSIGQAFRSAASLAAVAMLGTALLAGVNSLTADRIADQERRVILQQLGQVVSPDRFDNDLQEDFIEFSDESRFPGGQTVVAFRARKGGHPVAAVLKFAAVKGYNGKIQLLVGINPDGSLSGVRVTSHRETPGLGDAVEIEKSDWILGFSGRSLSQPPVEKWGVQRDGGAFDQFTGATITPRAVVEAVKMSLQYFAENRTFLFETPSANPAMVKP